MRIRTLTVPGLPFPLEAHGTTAPYAPVVDGDTVRLTAAAGADLFLDPRGAKQPRPDAERWTAPVDGDFQLQAHVAAGITRVVSVVTRDGASDDCDSWPIGETGTFLRITRLGAAFALHASDDAERWNMVRYFSPGRPAGDAVRIGFVAQSPAGAGTWATFRDVRFSRSTLREVRDGS